MRNAGPRNPLSPKKLLLSKWTAVTPRLKDKHFMVIKVLQPEPPITRIDMVELEAVRSRQVLLLHWRDLTDATQWRQGWV
jgi:tryptophan-rich hypothetical protein